MAHDIQAIKDRLDLREIFKRDGHVAKRMGANWFVPCPFHEEKSGSCKVEEKKFHCFGCGAGTDVFDYWERSRGISKKDAMDQLASLAGIAPLADYQPASARPAPRPKVEEIILPLTTAEREAWLACVERLRTQPAEIRRIAEWRGIGEDVIEWAIAHGVIGLKRWAGVWREAFLVEMPETPTGPLVPVSTHVRLAPHTQGNDRPKASWRFDPKERGAWPMVFGDTATAKHIFIVEGQWDALALIHLMHWHKAWPPTLAVVAMRGATSFRKFISHYALNDRATAFAIAIAIADADNAGAEWFVENGLAHQLSEKVRYVHAFWPGQRGADLNDLVKQGSITRDSMAAMLSPKLHNRRLRKPSGPTFLGWCRTRATAPEPLGWAARHVANDEARPKGRRPLKNWTRHWTKLALTTDIIAYNLLRALMNHGRSAGTESASFKGTIDRLNHWLPLVLNAPSARLRKRLVTDLTELVAEDQVPSRPFRREPRAVKRRPKPHQLLNVPRHQMIEISHRSRYKKPVDEIIPNDP